MGNKLNIIDNKENYTHFFYGGMIVPGPRINPKLVVPFN